MPSRSRDNAINVKLVSVRTTTENTIEYSTTWTGSIPVSTISAASTNTIIHAAANRDAVRGARNLPHGQPKNWAMLYADDNAVSIAAPANAKNIPASAVHSPTRPNWLAAAHAAVPGNDVSMWPGASSWRPTTSRLAASSPPSRTPTVTLARFIGM